MRLPASALRNVAACVTAFTIATTAPPDALAAAPSAEAQATLRKGYAAAAEGLLPSADSLLTKSITEWKQSGQPSDEISALFKARGKVRKQQGRLQEALADLDEAVKLLSSQTGPAEAQRTYVLRARVNGGLSRFLEAEADYSTAIARLDELEAIESTNPFLFSERAAVRSRLGRFEGAADDALAAVVEFKDIGDKVRSLIATSDAALALYGAGDVEDAVKKMQFTFSSNGNKSPATNNPDDIGLLQDLSRREAEMHLAYAAHLSASGQPNAAAQKQWETGCVRLEAFTQDGLQRQSAEQALRQVEAAKAEATGKEGGTLKAASVAGSIMNTDLIARLNGMDPESPFVTQRPQSGYIYYQAGGSAVQVRDAGTGLAEIDAGLSCARFRSAAWLRDNRPEWPPALVAGAEKYAAAVPQGPIVVPSKKSQVDRSECSVLLSKPGLGDAVPCF